MLELKQLWFSFLSVRIDVKLPAGFRISVLGTEG